MFKRSILFLLILFFFSKAYAYQQIDFIREIGDFDKKTKQHQLNGARAITIAGDKAYIADTDAHRIVVLDLTGKTLSVWGSKGDKPGQFKSPSGITVDEKGRVYVSDTGNNRIQVFDSDGKLVRRFGTKGSGPREFNTPYGLCAQRGFLYVADTGNNRVQVLSSDGTFIRQIEWRTKKEEMKSPVAVAADMQNRIYALDAGTDIVIIFDHDGNHIDHFGSKGRGTDGFEEPQGMAVDGSGNIYIADSGNYKLKKFDQKGRLVASFGSEGDGPGQFREATGVSVDPDGTAYVLDARRQVLQTFSTEKGDAKPIAPVSPPPGVELLKEIPGEVAAIAVDKRPWAVAGDSITALDAPSGRKIGSRGSDPGTLKNPRGLTIDASGKFWVADTGNNRLQKFSIEGNLLLAIGKSGSGEAEFHSPSGIAISPKGNIYVTDTGNKRVQVFNSKGVFLGMFGKAGKQPGQFMAPVGIAVDQTEHVYVADLGNDRIAKFDSNGTLVWETGRSGRQDGEFNEPSDILVSPDNEVFVLDSRNARIQVFDVNGKFLRKFGSEGKGAGEMRYPQGLALEDGLRLYAGDHSNGRVLVFTLRQTPAVPREVSAQARANEVQLNWKNNTESYLEQYNVYRADSENGPFKFIGSSHDPFFMDKGLPSNKTFFYRIASKAREGNESASSAAITTATPKLVPAAPRRIRTEALEKQITLSWLPNLEPFLNHYRIYRSKQASAGFEFLAKADRTVFIDTPLEDETVYYYQVTAVGKEGDESPAGEVAFASTPKAALTLPPLEIAGVQVGPVFASAYKYYEIHSIGTVTIRNNTDRPYPKIKLSFTIKDFMDYPTETEIDRLEPNQQVEIQLKPVFSNKILEVTENTPVQSELALTYYFAREPKTITRSFPVTIYERHAMVWDQKAKLGAFVTPKDPPVADFSRAVIRPYVDAYPNLHQSLVYARAVYDSLGVLGLKYIVDPTSPFQEFSEKSTSVDYLQFPRDTLARKSGDCDDLSILFAASLENLGIDTAFVDVPGHVFVMFNTGLPEKDKAILGFPEQMLVLYQGTVWVPVEMTMVGSSFTRAWQKGAQEYRDWSAKGTVDIVNVQKAWESFKPATLPSAASGAPKVTREEIEAAFKDELEDLGRQRLANLSADYIEALKKNPKNADALGQIGILYGENGLYAEALEQFQKLLAIDKNNPMALNNIGNINFLQERLDDAKIAYESSLKLAPGDAGIIANLSRVLLRLGKKEEARKMFQNAASIDPRVLRQYGDIAATLGMGK